MISLIEKGLHLGLLLVGQEANFIAKTFTSLQNHSSAYQSYPSLLIFFLLFFFFVDYKRKKRKQKQNARIEKII